MPETLRVALYTALYAFLGAAAAGLAGALALWLLRRRSVVVALNVVAAVAVCAMISGTLVVAYAMFLSTRDVSLVTTVVVMAAVVSFVTAVLVGRWVVARTRDLEQAAHSFVDGDGFTTPGAAATAELTSLGRKLASISAELTASRQRERALETSRREMVAWISHDLRTPLAGLRAMSEALEDGIAREPERYLRQIRTEVSRLDTMVDDLFELSRIQSGTLALTPARMSVCDLVAEALDGVAPLADEHGVSLADGGTDPVPIEVDGREMTRVLTNLLVNGIRRSPAPGPVAIGAKQYGETVVIAVSDACGGIPVEDLPHVFDMGWRGSAARTPSGAGLGLAIVQGIVEAHKGTVSVRNADDGCCFEVTLPVSSF